MIRRLLIEFALTAYPRDFRNAYRTQILSDIEEGQVHAAPAALNLLWSGLTMRADLFGRDVIYALRRLRKMPLFVAIVALTFALGIGANVAVFSILNTVLLKPLPYANIDRLVVFRLHNAHQPGVGASLSVPEVNDFISQSRTLHFISASSPDGATLTGAGKPRALIGDDVTPQFFESLGVRPQLGRFFTEADERKGVSSAIISDRLWRGAFGADPHIAGKVLRLNDVPYTIVGVAPPRLLVPDAQRGSLVTADYWLVQPDRVPPSQRGASYLGGMAVLQPDTSLAAANAELALISKRLQKQYPGFESGVQYFAVPLTRVIFGSISPALWTLFVAVLGILIITCANVASMLLTSASTRDREFAVRSALGASRRRLAEQLLIETGALAVFGGILGVALAYGILGMLRPALSILPHVDSLGIDTSGLLYALGIVIICTLLAGVWPIAALRHRELQTTLKAAGRSGTGSGGNRLRSALVVSEVSVALALVVLSGLVARSYFALIHGDLGVRPGGVVATTIFALPDSRYGSLPAREAFEKHLLDRLHAIPGVESAALAVSYPLSNMSMQFQIGIVGKTFAQGQEPSLLTNTVSPDYFHALGIPVLQGRTFTERDSSASQPVAIVNEDFARLYAGDGKPLGMRINTPGWNGTRHATRTIVGVVANERAQLQDVARPEFYVPLRQGPPNILSAIVRSSSVPPTALGTAVRDAITKTDPALAAPGTSTFAQLVAQNSQEPRSIATLLGSLGLVALLLALCGIFGVVSYSVTQRYAEFGVRVALGARWSGVLVDVILRALKVTALGAAIGLCLAALAGHALGSQLYHISPLDPATFTGVPALVAICSAVAAMLPAIRVVRIDPAAALRYE